MLFLMLNTQIALADCELEPSIVDALGPGESIELNLVNCSEANSCSFQLNSSGGGQLTDNEDGSATYVAPSDVQCEIEISIESICVGNSDLNQSVNFTVNASEPCKVSGGGCNAPGYGFFFIAPLLFRRRRKQ